MPFSKLPRESLRALYYKLGGTDDISDLRTRRALLKKIYEAMGNDSVDLDNMHRANSVLQKISEVASVGGKYVGVDISDGRLLFPTMENSASNPWRLSPMATAEVNAILSEDKIPIFELPSGYFPSGSTSIYGISSEWATGFAGWKAVIVFRSSLGGVITTQNVYCQSSDYASGDPSISQ